MNESKSTISPYARIGNKHPYKLDKMSAELRKKVYQSYCEHLAQGFSQDCWCYESDEITLTYKTMNKYLETEPGVFPPVYKEIAEIKGKKGWESVINDSAKGKNRKANAITLQLVMRNKYGWDRPDDAKIKSSPNEDLLIKEDEIVKLKYKISQLEHESKPQANPQL
jgi:hypothetical protein